MSALWSNTFLNQSWKHRQSVFNEKLFKVQRIRTTKHSNFQQLCKSKPVCKRKNVSVLYRSVTGSFHCVTQGKTIRCPNTACFLVRNVTVPRAEQPKKLVSITGKGKRPLSPPWRLDCLWGAQGGRRVKLTTHLHLVPMVWRSGVVPPSPHVSSWREHEIYIVMFHVLFHYNISYPSDT